MTKEQLEQRLAQQQPPIPQGFEARHDALLNRLTKQEVVMKKRISFVAIAVLVLLLAALGIAVAAELGVFGQMSEQYARPDNKLKQLDQVAQVYTQQTDVPAEAVGFAAVHFALNQAHFDGETLYVSYSLTPGWDTALVQQTVDVSSIEWDTTPDVAVMNSNWEKRLSPETYQQMQKMLEETGEVFLTVYEQYLGDGVYLPDGSYASVQGADEMRTATGEKIGYKRLLVPDGTGDSVELSFPLYRAVAYYYRNAEGCYYKYGHDREELMLKATVERNASKAEAVLYNASFWNHDAQVTLWVSDMDIQAKVQLQLNKEDAQLFEEHWDNPALDTLEMFLLYAGGQEVRVTATECGIDENYLMTMDLEYEKPEKIDALQLVPYYANSGAHMEEALNLK